MGTPTKRSSGKPSLENVKTKQKKTRLFSERDSANNTPHDKQASGDDLDPQGPLASKRFSAGRMNRNLVVLHLRADFQWRPRLRIHRKGARESGSWGQAGSERIAD